MLARKSYRSRVLVASGLVYFVASAAHFAHNAEFLAEYPNLPAWLSRAKVYLAWLAVTVPGVLALVATRKGWSKSALVLAGLYGSLGFLGLDHYWVAPIGAHTIGANATILTEVVAGAVLLCIASWLLVQRARSPVGAAGA